MTGDSVYYPILVLNGWFCTESVTSMPSSSERSEAKSFSDLGEALSGFFDPDWYVSRYPDIVASGLEPMHHFVHHGAAEGRDPNRFFDGAWYLCALP